MHAHARADPRAGAGVAGIAATCSPSERLGLDRLELGARGGPLRALALRGAGGGQRVLLSIAHLAGGSCRTGIQPVEIGSALSNGDRHDEGDGTSPRELKGRCTEGD